jgi:outer membrane protein assembly factor BamE (lipoprotein component of BamABCDE complex)
MLLGGYRENMRRGINNRQGDRAGARLPGADRRGLGCRKAMAAAAVASFLLAACATSVTKHGHHFQETDVQQIQPGMSQDQVRMALGTPATTAAVGPGNAYYYISSTTSQSSFLTPTEVDRQVVAVYFSRTGSVERVAQYGMKDGKVFDYVSRTTPSVNNNDEGLLKQLFRNLGRGGAIFND